MLIRFKNQMCIVSEHLRGKGEGGQGCFTFNSEVTNNVQAMLIVMHKLTRNWSLKKNFALMYVSLSPGSLLSAENTLLQTK